MHCCIGVMLLYPRGKKIIFQISTSIFYIHEFCKQSWGKSWLVVYFSLKTSKTIFISKEMYNFLVYMSALSFFGFPKAIKFKSLQNKNPLIHPFYKFINKVIGGFWA